MPNILVVDDSPVDRRLVGGLLEADPSMKAAYATNGREALEKLRGDLPDAMVTDLQMPEMDGLQLVTAVKARYPRLPVILVTARGSEEIAVQALQSGAASYVPKDALSRDLLKTVRHVLSLAVEQRGLMDLMQGLVKSECEFVLPNDRTAFPPLIRYLQASVTLAGLCFETERTRLGVALYEALTNALEHGNLEVGSARQAPDVAAYLKLCDERREQSPYKDRRLRVRMSVTPEKAEFTIRDEGPGFDAAALNDKDESDFSGGAGRGLLLIRSLVDEVTFNDRGNEAKLVKLSDYRLADVVFEA